MTPTPKCVCALTMAMFAAVPAAAGADSGIVPELAQVLGQQDAQAVGSRVDGLREALRPICVSMPHNEHGRMGPSVVRYVLHRFFMQRGWSIRGLEPEGQGWSVGSPAQMLGEGAPEQLVKLFDERLSHQGLDLDEVAALAATFLSVVVRRELRQNLEAAYRTHALDRNGSIGEEDAYRVLDTYAASYVIGKDISGLTEWEIHVVETRAPREYHNLPQVKQLARDAKRSVVGGGAVSFSEMEGIAEELGARFGPAENEHECSPRRQDLLELEHRGSGRVPLSEFYRAALRGKWHFGESSAYLRQLGALDESDAGNLQVIIPNYMNSKSNCVDSSRYYSVCCLNECDRLLARLERDIGSPGATPAEIARIVASMASATVPGNRTLSAPLMQRLEEVADGNGGRVPLHGRLFAQWMHHAYPRECPFPHISGTTAPVRVGDWAAEPGNEVVASREEMQQHAGAPRAEQRPSADDEADEDGECAPWMEHEEILAPHAPLDAARQAEQRNPAPATWWVVSAAALLLALSTGSARLAAPRSSGGVSCGKDREEVGDPVIVYNV
mmetsp:Transcript_55715/g.165698  ORF Transcript_55715/g.165698 Transcript_55715/m.165698 type:complete len:557 (+) Transcript_55715:68-1738(+)